MKICLVCSEILGAHRNGGIGTATSHLALLLAHHGHAVTLFYTGAEHLDPLSSWASYYAAAKVTVCACPAFADQIQPTWMQKPTEVYEQLQQRDFDVILFQEWLGLGHACMVAKKAGLAFRNTTLAVIAHSSTSWIFEANRTFPNSAADLGVMHMERQSVELADALISPSRYLVEWMCGAGWNLPARTSVIPYFLAGAELVGAQCALAGIPRPRSDFAPHLVFFGRWEERKGISIFLSALASQELKPFRFRLTFLGRSAHRSGDEIRRAVAKHRPDLVADLSLLDNLATDEAQAFLASTNGIAVIPSLVDNSPCVIYECLKLGVPFVAASVGGVPELINSEDETRCLFQPTAQALAQKLSEVLSSKSWKSPRPSYQEPEVGARWLAWFEEHAPVPARTTVSLPAAEDITVVVTHFERPNLVQQTLRALAGQTDRLFQVVLVDDGSTSEAASAFLDRASRGFAGLDIQLVRQGSNRYIGAARNEGVRHAQGSRIIFLDDDNVPFPNLVEVFRKAARSCGADIVTCQMQFWRDPEREPDFRTLIPGERWAFPGGPLELGLIRNCFGDATGIYKREVFDRIGGFHEIYGLALEDWQFHLRAYLEGLQLLSLPVPLFWYRITPGSMMRSTNHTANMRVVASAFQAHLPRELSKIADFVIGTNRPWDS